MARRAVGVSKARSGNGWRARYRDSTGREHERLLPTWEQARDWREEQVARVRRGTWVDPVDGRTPLRVYAEMWRAGAGHREQSGQTVERRLRLHVYPVLGDRPIGDLRHSELRAWLSGLERTMSPWSVYGVHSITRTILNTAVADQLIHVSPFARIPLEPVRRAEPVVPMTVPQVQAVLEACEGRSAVWRALFTLGAATGMRGGELLGLDLDDVDFLRRTVRVRRQLVGGPGWGPFAWGPPKTSASHRLLEVPSWGLEEVAWHLSEHPPQPITLPVLDTAGETERTGRLVFTTSTGRPISRGNMVRAWHGAAERAGLVRTSGPHALRHHVASVLIDAGQSVKAVQAQLGHATAMETLSTYAHLLPDQGARTRGALESAWVVARTGDDAETSRG